MKKILIISEFFAPQNAIGAVRPTKFAKYLKRQGGYDITVVTKEVMTNIVDSSLQNDMILIDKIFYCKPGKFVCWVNQKIHQAKQSSFYDSNELNSMKALKKLTIKKKMYQTIRFLVQVLNDISYSRLAWKILQEAGKAEYDVVISTYGPFSSHLLGGKIKKRHSQTLWIADFRDQVYTDDAPKPFRGFCKRYVQRIIKKADVITAVSTGVLDSLSLMDEKRCCIITNGFDREDLPLHVSENNLISRKMRLLYTGQMYFGQRDLSLLFKALSELITEESIPADSIQIEYAGNSFDEFLRQAASFGLQDQLINHGYVSRARSLQMQKEAQVLLLASWNRMGSTGIVTGKFLEYMLMDKPIICIITGNLPNSQLKQMIANAQNGICCEEAAGMADFISLKQYLLSLYNEYQENGQLCIYPNEEYIETYNYQNITRELEKLFLR